MKIIKPLLLFLSILNLGGCASLFRMVEQGWTKEEAIQEMVEGGYGYNRAWINILQYVKRVDVAKIRKELEN